MKILAEQWATVSKLLDEALDLDAEARPTWLERLTGREPQIGTIVKRLLAAHVDHETADLLATLPRLHLPAAPSMSFAALAAGERVGPYRLLRELGTGGMAHVWLAQRDDGAFTREVALKIPQLSRLRHDLAARFVRERDILARLEHPNIARLYDAGVSADDLPYLAMEYVDGTPITQHCDGQRFGVAARLRLFAQVLGAVQYAHAHLVIHRDLKPSNILVTADGQVRLLDFGIAKLLEGDAVPETPLTQSAGRALTPDYASPEQIKGEALTIATDVYSLGVVLYELLAGCRPYRLQVKSAAQLEQAIIAAEPIRPSANIDSGAAIARCVTAGKLARALSGELDTIVLKALAKSPAERYATIAAFADDLQRHLDGRPVLARPASAWYRFRKFVVRHRWPVLFTAAAAAILTAVAAIAVVQAQLAFAEARKASAVKDFLLDVLGSADPSLSIDKPASEVTIQQALDAAARRIGTALDEQPEVKISVLKTLGSVYTSLDLIDQSLALEKEALALSERHHSVPHATQAELTVVIAGGNMFAGRFDEAQQWLDRSEKLFERLGDRRSVFYGHMLKIKGNLLRRQGNKQFPAARRVLEQAASLFRDRYPQDEGRMGTLFNLANVLRDLGDMEEAARIADEAVEVAARSNRPGFDVPNAYSLRAAIRASDGDLHGAETDYRAAAAGYRKSSGEKHFLTLQNDSLLGLALLQLGQRDAGLQLTRTSASALAVTRAGSNTHVAAIQRLGMAHLMLGDFGRAAPVFEQGRAIWVQRRDDLQRTGTTVHLAAAYAALGRYAEARELLDEALTIRREREHRAVLPLAQVHLLLGQLALDQRQPADARLQLETVLELSPTQTTSDLIRQVSARAALARLAVLNGDAGAALEASQTALAVARHARVRQHVAVLATALEARGRSQCRFGAAAEGEPLLAEASALMEQAVDPGSPMLASTRLAHAACLLLLQRVTQAHAAFAAAHAVLAAHGKLALHFGEELRAVQQELQANATTR